MDLLDWARGPLLYAALAIFTVGVAWRLIALRRLPVTTAVAPARRPFGSSAALRAQVEATGADAVVVSCASCRLNFLEGAAVAQSPMRIESQVELVAAGLPRAPEAVAPGPGPHV